MEAYTRHQILLFNPKNDFSDADIPISIFIRSFAQQLGIDERKIVETIKKNEANTSSLGLCQIVRFEYILLSIGQLFKILSLQNIIFQDDDNLEGNNINLNKFKRYF